MTLTRYELHKLKWKDCTRCVLADSRRNVVLLRGKIPADVLFIGEAPGRSEDALGKPFIGPAGKLLDSIIRESLEEDTRYALTNLVGCIPLEEGKKAGEPSKESIQECVPRLSEIVKLVSPRVVVLVGSLAQKYPPSGDFETIGIVHPSAILRMNVVARPLEIKRCIVAIRDVVEEVIG